VIVIIFGAFASLTVLRVILIFKTVRSMASTLFVVFPVIINILLVCLGLMYFFAVIGMELFHGVKKSLFFHFFFLNFAK
jgi:hypothetical protein